MPYESRVGNRLRLGRFNPSCPPGQRDNVAARFKRVEPISEAAGILDALGEIGSPCRSARRGVAEGTCPNAAEPTCGGAPISPSMVLKVRRNACGIDLDPQPRFHLRVHFGQLPITAPRAPGKASARLAGAYALESRDQTRGQRHDVVGHQPARLDVLPPPTGQRPQSPVEIELSRHAAWQTSLQRAPVRKHHPDGDIAQAIR